MKDWQYNALFIVGVGGTIALFFIKDVNPAAATGVGAIMTYVLTQRENLTHHNKRGKKKEDNHDDDKHS